MSSEWWTYLAIAIGAVALLIAFSLFFVNARTRRLFKAQSEENQQTLETLVEMGKRLVAMQADIQALQQKHQSQDLGNNYKAYSQAAELLNRGVPMHEVMQRCQLSKGEAELLAAMTQRSKHSE